MRHLEDGRIPLETNRVENAIRPFVIGRKNWLFADTVRGAEASANIYSLIETAKANGLEPFAYPQYMIAKLPNAQTLEQPRRCARKASNRGPSEPKSTRQIARRLRPFD